MKMIVAIALALVAAAAAAPTDKPVAILHSEFDQSPTGSYHFGFQAENGITKGEEGDLKEVLDVENKPHPVVVVRGSYSYTDPDGQVQTIHYFADETGYHAEGDSIPHV